jgi:hypothetical protein
MKRVVSLFAFTFIYLAVNNPALAQADSQSSDRKACPFNIIGLWKSDVTTQSNPVFFSFSANGWVTLLGFSPDRLPQDFEMLTEVTYQLDTPAKPKRIEFRTSRGNDAFPPGITLLKIIEYGENSFTTIDEISEQKILWLRAPTHRYFLTFITRNATPVQNEVAYILWTMLDGRKAKTEALGIQTVKDEAGKPVPVFGQIPAEVYEPITVENEKDRKGKKEETIMMRFELTQTEFGSTRKLFENWEQQLKTNTLPFSSPYQNQLEFLSRALDGLIPCGAKTKLYKPTQRERDEITARQQLSQQPFEFIKHLRQKNTELHVDDIIFPWGWRPSLQVP